MQGTLTDQTVTTRDAATASGGTAITSTAADCAAYSGFRASVTVATANAGNTVQHQHSDTNVDGNFVDSDLPAAVAVANGDQAVVDVKHPTKQFNRVRIVRSGADTALGEIVTDVYGPKKLSADQPSTTAVSQGVSPSDA